MEGLERYMKLGLHRCKASPTGAHYWGIGTTNHVPGTPATCWVCQYCGEVRQTLGSRPAESIEAA